MSDIWEEEIGPLYEVGEAAQILGASPEVLKERAKRGEALQLEDGRFPGWQFDLKRFMVYPALIEIMKILNGEDVDPTFVASFCLTPQPELDANMLVIPLDLFEEGGSPELLVAARRAAATLRR